MRNLKWYDRNPDLPTTPNDRAVRKLVHRLEGDDAELGLVCELGNGKYWSFTTNSLLACMPPKLYLIHHDTLEGASDALYNYVVEDLQRLEKLHTPHEYRLTMRYKRRDGDAYIQYKKVFKNDTKLAFKSGVDWVLKSEGFPRRPSWALFLTQNVDGTMFWHEQLPKIDHSTGRWTSTAQTLQVTLSESFNKNIIRLT